MAFFSMANTCSIHYHSPSPPLLHSAACSLPPLLPPSSTILLSVISLLNEPNTFSAANVDASVLYRKWRDSRGKDKQYIDLIRWADGLASSYPVHLFYLLLALLTSLPPPSFPPSLPPFLSLPLSPSLSLSLPLSLSASPLPGNRWTAPDERLM